MAKAGRPKKYKTLTPEQTKRRKQIKEYPAHVYTTNVHKAPTKGERLLVDLYCSNGFNKLEAHLLAFPNQKDPKSGHISNVFRRPKVKYLIDKKIQEEVMDKIEKTTEDILKELDDLLEATKDSETGNLAVRKGVVELFMRYKGMLIDKREVTNQTAAEFVEEEEKKKKAQGSDLKIVEMTKDET